MNTIKKLLESLRRWWMTFARALGWLNTRLLLSLVYFIVIGIPALILRVIGKDLLDRRVGDRKSYWISKEEASHSIEGAKHQF